MSSECRLLKLASEYNCTTKDYPMTALLERSLNQPGLQQQAAQSLAAQSLEVPPQHSADRILALRVAHALAETHVPILRTLKIEVRDGAVTLRGRVRNYYERQLAHVRAKRVPDVRRVTEEITVATQPGAAAGLALWSSDVLPIDVRQRSA
jgi:osmotically-inducible protein OsmY